MRQLCLWEDRVLEQETSNPNVRPEGQGTWLLSEERLGYGIPQLQLNLGHQSPEALARIPEVQGAEGKLTSKAQTPEQEEAQGKTSALQCLGQPSDGPPLR